ncbi:MAG: proline--tRNA ligase [archaeon]|nr:MAG: proline--tRNA ligase [archaeon]
MKKKEIGITAEKDEFSEWFVQLIQKAELIEYSNVSGCYILRPRCYFIWEQVMKYFDDKIKKDGVKNAYFPLLVSESNLAKEKEHVEGFNPEVAWVTQTGNTKLKERLAIRPTSESSMYPAYAKWIRSWRDLPLRLNQWNNVVRWEFKNPIPLIRFREFLWQEGHSAFATEKEAIQEVEKILDYYVDVYKDIFAIPVIKGVKTDKEKFAGADKTLTTEVFLPSRKCAQAGTSHNLGQNFAKAFDIKFKDENGKERYVWQNSWGLSARSIGIAIMMHSDSKGLVVSPKVAETQVVIVPIYKKDKKQVVSEAKKIKLGKVRVEIDDRDVSPGFKFNDWEMKGIPIRLELGPKDIKLKQVVLVRRDTGKKEFVKIKDVAKKVEKVLEDIHNNLYNKAKRHLKNNTVLAKNISDVVKSIKNKKLVKTEWCGNQKCEDWIKTKTGGAKIICKINEKPKGKCCYCGKKSNSVVYIAKSY